MTSRVATLYDRLERAEASAQQATTERDRLIRLLHSEGESLRVIASHTSLSHMAVKRIIAKENS